ncbi:MAG: DUF3159 domain-containing protein [Dactylosporangium sp.]|nr:DUF3159 domain-containing protein [Dactylosporangium sp.]NNJ62144.1 DUF3159 domain-containing protein [Dactylosporangium sp.]
MTAQPGSVDPTELIDEEPLPSFSEQVSQQLGGIRGLVETSIPVAVFVVLNFAGSRTELWSLRASLIASVTFALAVAAFRLARRQPVRYAVNGVLGILLGAAMAWRSGEARDFHLLSIIYTIGYATAMLLSVLARRPLVGWLWAVTLDGGAPRWHKQQSLRRAFVWLTVLWATIYLLKASIQLPLYWANAEDLLGASRIVFGWPPYALLFALTVWSARRVLRREPSLVTGELVAPESPAVTPEGSPAHPG